jgi:AcrR family transcriptional regulator
MAIRSRTVRLADADIGAHRHICGLFEGPNEAATVLKPFILDGLAQGDRVVHLVEDPASYLADWPDPALVESAIKSGQLQVQSWSESYVSGGVFRAAGMVAYVRRALRETRKLGYPRARLIGDMQWARDDVPGVEQLISYEAAIDDVVGHPPHAVICAYDVRRHASSRIASILSAHQAVLVGGRFQPRLDGHSTWGPRARILSAASELFGAAGVRATGVDSLIATAEVAKATFYRHFPSKDDLVVAWLEDPRTRWFDRVQIEAERRAASPDDVIPEFFDAVSDWLEGGDFRGCPFLATSVEILDPGHAATAVIRDRLDEIRTYLVDRAAAGGYSDPAALGHALQTLLAGSISLSVAYRDTSFVLSARQAATALLRSADRSAPLIR